jgi:hypothetical protein
MSRVLRRPPPAILAGHRRWLVVAGAAFVVAAAAVVLSVTSSKPTSDEATKVVAAPNTVVALDPRNDRLVDKFFVGRVPTQPAIGGQSVWVFNSADRTMSWIDPRRRAVRAFSIGRVGPRIGLAFGPDSAWVAVGTVYRIDLRSAAVHTVRLPHGAGAGVVAGGPTDVWLIGGKRLKPPPPGQFVAPHTLAWRIDPRTNDVKRVIRLEASVLGESSPMAAVIAGDSLWLRSQIGVVRLDRRTGRLRSQLRLSDPAHSNVPQWGGFAAGAGSLWVTDIGRGVVWRVDLETGTTVAKIPISGRLAGLAIGAGAVWVADANGAILKVDPRTNEIVARIPVDGSPNGLAFGFGRLWIAFD